TAAEGAAIAGYLHSKSPSPSTARYVALFAQRDRHESQRQEPQEIGEEEFGLKLEAAADWMFEKWQAAKDQVYLGRDGQPHPRRGGLVGASSAGAGRGPSPRVPGRSNTRANRRCSPRPEAGAARRCLVPRRRGAPAGTTRAAWSPGCPSTAPGGPPISSNATAVASDRATR